ncbi:hypothetical protein IWX90DRAFT_34791 [Phyllosticta citrichinensis]|uniref:Uncharacterized protein n=1 Tax=Phyllosticta citrichinensis TaxID=1130410 RepID=A0ABR1Y7I9_9PEZI
MAALHWYRTSRLVHTVRNRRCLRENEHCSSLFRPRGVQPHRMKPGSSGLSNLPCVKSELTKRGQVVPPARVVSGTFFGRLTASAAELQAQPYATQVKSATAWGARHVEAALPRLQHSVNALLFHSTAQEQMRRLPIALTARAAHSRGLIRRRHRTQRRGEQDALKPQLHTVNALLFHSTAQKQMRRRPIALTVHAANRKSVIRHFISASMQGRARPCFGVAKARCETCWICRDQERKEVGGLLFALPCSALPSPSQSRRI